MKNKIEIELENEGKTIFINPPDGGYQKGEKYEIHIRNNIKYTDGEKLSKAYAMQFVMVRDEVEEGVVNPEIKKEYVKIIDKNILEIKNKGIKSKLKKGEIIIFPTNEHPEG
ncbi:hypothetical protein [Niallia nealsonii]|uniref:Uncharacterized protein n=1 Tax=Niallia nealsonii TaxID=115979 RepID=A0A2N0YWK3_9BACI|nr:hypothetical protein [Niallia nealsonii]PKG21637.1 hypothetical protein CWS01_21355 [Niallia nealsonii]